MHPLRHQIDRLRRQARWLMLAYGAACVVIALVGSFLLLGLADYVVRFQDRGVRLIASLTVLGISAWTVYRYLVPVLRARLSDVGIARRVEKRFPALADRLSSAIDFLNQPEEDSAAGSAELRRAAITQTLADAENLQWSSAVDRRPSLRVGSAAAAVVLIAIALGIANPQTARVAIQRLAAPWSETAWPRQHHLAFRDMVTRVAIGQNFEVELIDENGAPPHDARIVYRYSVAGENGEVEESTPVKLAGTLIARRENVLHPFEYRAVGGDDYTMRWIQVEVVEPPAVESVSISLQPPAYTGWPAMPSERRIEALRGTRVHVDGRSTRRIVSAAVHQQNGPSVPLHITHGGRGFLLPADPSTTAAPAGSSAIDGETSAAAWIIDKSGKYWIELRDEEGLVGGTDDRWDVRAVADEPPRITLERPIGTLFATPAALIPLKLDVRDDLAIQKVALHFLRSDSSEKGEQSVVLYSGPDRALPPQASNEIAPTRAGESRLVEHDWDLRPLGLTAGIQLTMTATATDYRPQTGVSQAVRVIVITPDEFEDRISARQAAILAEIARVLKMQQETRAATAALLTQADRVGELRKQDADSAHTAELTQRQIRRSLASPSEGVLGQAAALLEELAANRIDNPEAMRRVEGIEQVIRRLDSDSLATVEQELVALVKNSQLALDAPGANRDIIARIAGSLATAIAAQDSVVAALEKLLGDLSQWNDYRAIAREIAEVQREQRALTARTAKIQPETIGRDAKDLGPQPQADLQNMASVQGELARRFDKLQERMEQIQGELGQAPLAAESLSEAMAFARRAGIGANMRDSARYVEGNRLGQAIETQKAVDAKLSDLLDILSNRREQELARLVKKLRAAEEQLTAFRQRQAGLRKKIREAYERLAAANDAAQQESQRKELERLMRQEQKLADDIERLSRDLMRLQAQRALEKTSAAADNLRAAADANQRGETGKAADLAGQAQRDLEAAQNELAARRRQAEQDLANQQLATVEHALAGLISRQQAALAETKRLHALRDASGRLKPDQANSLGALVENERHLKAEADGIAEKVTAAEVFQLGVTSAAEQIQRAAALLSQGDTGDPPQRAEIQALARLRQLLAALKEGQSAASGQNPPNPADSGDDGGQQTQRPAPVVHSVTEIKLLAVMQEDVNKRTIELQEQLGQRPPTEAEKSELALLAQEQRGIAELAARLTARAAPQRPIANPEDDPESLPDTRAPSRPADSDNSD